MEKISRGGRLVNSLARVLKMKEQPLNIKNKDYPYYFSSPTKTILKKYHVDKMVVCNKNVYIINKKKENDRTNKVILYFHGGSFVYNFTAFHWRFIDKLISFSNCNIVAPDYPLAPESSCLDTIHMVFELYKILKATYETKNIILMGDSAGGGLCLSLLQLLKKENIMQPKKAILLSPWLDITLTNPEIEKIDKNDPFLEKSSLIYAGAMYARNLDYKNYLVSPIYGDLDLSCKIYVFSGTYDILNADSQELVKKSVHHMINYYEYSKMIHCFMFLKIPEANDVFLKILKIIK